MWRFVAARKHNSLNFLRNAHKRLLSADRNCRQLGTVLPSEVRNKNGTALELCKIRLRPRNCNSCVRLDCGIGFHDQWSRCYTNTARLMSLLIISMRLIRFRFRLSNVIRNSATGIVKQGCLGSSIDRHIMRVFQCPRMHAAQRPALIENTCMSHVRICKSKFPIVLALSDNRPSISVGDRISAQSIR